MSPRVLIPQGWVEVAPGKSIVVKVGPSARTFDEAPSAKLSASKKSFHCRLICPSTLNRRQMRPERIMQGQQFKETARWYNSAHTRCIERQNLVNRLWTT